MQTLQPQRASAKPLQLRKYAISKLFFVKLILKSLKKQLAFMLKIPTAGEESFLEAFHGELDCSTDSRDLLFLNLLSEVLLHFSLALFHKPQTQDLFCVVVIGFLIIIYFYFLFPPSENYKMR